ncbi:MAG: acetyl-CoA hydrolase, partial [Gammaproteobacteria bacterium]
FFKAGSYLNHPGQQQNYIMSNYTHVFRDLMDYGLNVAAQMIAVKEIDGERRYSLSCNPDVAIDLEPELRERERQGKPVAIVGEVNRNLPFMRNDAEVGADSFDFILDNEAYDYPLFGAPNMAVTPVDHLIGFHASTLVRDDGTLQVGIGSLGTALTNAVMLRHQNNALYREICEELDLVNRFPVIERIGGLGTFEKGLYGCSEMMVDGFLHLYNAGILKRAVYPDLTLQTLINQGKVGETPTVEALDALAEAGAISHKLLARDVEYLKRFGLLAQSVQFKGGHLLLDEDNHAEADLRKDETRQWIAANALGDQLKGGIVMHGGFFLGPRNFYEMLHALTDEDHEKICMTSVRFINHLYDHRLGSEQLKIAQRQHARFINSTMIATLLGACVSDGLDNGKVVSGVGGQYNFVAMAHDTPGARSILKLKSTRVAGGQTVSNIQFNYGYCTIPRHLRDIYVTEYGIADLRGRSDAECIIEMLKIADSRFQPQLMAQAKAAGKLPQDYQLPEAYRQNTPERVAQVFAKFSSKGAFDPFPFGCDFTEEELKIGKALKALKARTATRKGLLTTIWQSVRRRDIPREILPLIERMDMLHPADFKEKLEQKLLVNELANQLGL